MKQKHFIDANKAVTGLVVLLMMAVYKQWNNPTAWIYLALHGSYGLFWVTKSQIFPDKQWEQPAPFWYGLVIYFGLATYWVAPFLINSGGVEAPAWFLGLCVALYSGGVFLHFAADMQKHISLQLRPNRLITGGLWARVRNPNYLGELMIYLSFALLAVHWLPLVILAAWVLVIWLPNMIKKDRSLRRYPEFGEYKKRTKMLIPWLF